MILHQINLSMDSTTCLNRQHGMFIVGVFSYVFSFTSFTVVLDSSSAYGQAVCSCKAPKQFSSDALSSRHLFSSATAMAASAPGVLEGFELAVLGFFSDFFRFEFHVKFLI